MTICPIYHIVYLFFARCACSALNPFSTRSPPQASHFASTLRQERGLSPLWKSSLQCGWEFGWIVSPEGSVAQNPSAVPQGSMLGSTQFNIFTNDLDDGRVHSQKSHRYQAGARTTCWRTYCSSGCRKDPAQTSWSSAKVAEELFCWLWVQQRPTRREAKGKGVVWSKTLGETLLPPTT